MRLKSAWTQKASMSQSSGLKCKVVRIRERIRSRPCYLKLKMYIEVATTAENAQLFCLSYNIDDLNTKNTCEIVITTFIQKWHVSL